MSAHTLAPPYALQYRDLLRRALLDLCWRWGYELAIPPLIEYLDSLLSGMGEDLDHCMRQLGRSLETLLPVAEALNYTIALENMLWRGFDHRWALAAAFGLVHGLGFYGAISGVDLARNSVLSTLLAFNLGVEAGQIAIVGLAYLPLLYWARQPWYKASATIGSAMIFALACWWAVGRMFVT